MVETIIALPVLLILSLGSLQMIFLY